MEETYGFTFVLITMAKFVAFGTPKPDAIKGDKTLLFSRTKNNPSSFHQMITYMELIGSSKHTKHNSCSKLEIFISDYNESNTASKIMKLLFLNQ